MTTVVVKRRRWAKVFLVVSVVLAVIAVAFAADTIATMHTCSQLICEDTISSVLQYGSLVLMAALAVWLTAKESREVRAEDRQREVAAHGIAAALSVERELGSAVPATLALPMTLRLRWAWRTVQTGITFSIVFVILEFAYLITLSTRSASRPVTIAYTVGGQGFVLGVLVLTLGAVWFAAREQVVAAEDGLSVRRGGVTHHIRWTDARLFALIGPNAFELSGPRAIVRWTCPTDASFYDTVIPLEEYQLQMGELLLLIAARTGLPLSDLSQTAR